MGPPVGLAAQPTKGAATPGVGGGEPPLAPVGLGGLIRVEVATLPFAPGVADASGEAAQALASTAPIASANTALIACSTSRPSRRLCPPLPIGERAGERGLSWHNRTELSASLIAVILAAGHGTRMRSRTPKVLHPICGRPMVDWVLNALKEAGAKDVKVIANPHHADVAAHLDGRVELVYQRDPKGTAHAL